MQKSFVISLILRVSAVVLVVVPLVIVGSFAVIAAVHFDSRQHEPFSGPIPTSPPDVRAEWGYAEGVAYRVLTRFTFEGDRVSLIETPRGNLFLARSWDEVVDLEPGTFFKVTDDGVVTLSREAAVAMDVPGSSLEEGRPLSHEETGEVLQELQRWDNRDRSEEEDLSA